MHKDVRTALRDRLVGFAILLFLQATRGSAGRLQSSASLRILFRQGVTLLSIVAIHPVAPVVMFVALAVVIVVVNRRG